MAELVGVFLVGLMGSAHCIGMCGGFVLLLAQHGGARHLQRTQSLYYLGKTTTYAVLGFAAGGLSAALGTLFASMQQGLSIALGLVLVVVGLSLMGILRRMEGARWWAKVPGLSRVLSRVAQHPGPGAVFSLGLLNGLLPCGLVYGMLALAAASGSAPQGALLMAVFGLSTIPALYLVGVSGFLMRPVWWQRFNWIGGVLVVALGVLTMVRGLPAFDGLLHSLHSDPALHSMMHHP